MTGPTGNSKLCFPENLIVKEGLSEAKLSVSGGGGGTHQVFSEKSPIVSVWMGEKGAFRKC